MANLIVQFQTDKNLTIDLFCLEYSIDRQYVDSDYGIIEIDPLDNLYSALVDEKALPLDPRLQCFSNPNIQSQ